MCEGGQIECKYRQTEDKVCVFFYATLNMSGSYHRLVAECRTDLHNKARSSKKIDGFYFKVPVSVTGVMGLIFRVTGIVVKGYWVSC